MIRTVKAVIDPHGHVKLLEPVELSGVRRAFVMILEDASENDAAVLSERVLGEDWNQPEEDAAWSHLQPPQ